MKDERGVGGGGAVHLRPIQRAGGLSAFGRFNERGCCPLSADSTSGGVVGVLSAFGRFNERGGAAEGAVRFRPIQRSGGGGGEGLTGLYMYM